MDIKIKIDYANDKLQKARQSAGLSQSQLSESTGIGVRVLQSYEQGARDLNGAKLETLLKLCRALNCKLPDIITDKSVLSLLAEYEK